MPVTSLLLLSRGTQLSDIAWLMGLYSFTVILSLIHISIPLSTKPTREKSVPGRLNGLKG